VAFPPPSLAPSVPHRRRHPAPFPSAKSIHRPAASAMPDTDTQASVAGPARFPRDPNHLSLHGTQIIVATCPSIIRGLNHSSACETLAPVLSKGLIPERGFTRALLSFLPRSSRRSPRRKGREAFHYRSLLFAESIARAVLSLSLSLSARGRRQKNRENLRFGISRSLAESKREREGRSGPRAPPSPRTTREPLIRGG